MAASRASQATVARLIATAAAVALGLAVGCGSIGQQPVAQPSASAERPTTALAPVLPPPSRQVVVVGDEYATGTENGGLGATNWTNNLQRDLGAAGVDAYVRNFATAGHGYTPRSPDARVFADDVTRGVNPDTDLLILLGGGRYSGSPDDLATAVRRTMAAARAIAPGLKILLVGPMWLRQQPPDPDTFAARDAIRGVARATSTTFLDPIGDRWFTPDGRMAASDGIYPSDKAQPVIAERIAGPAETLLEQTATR